MSLCPCGADKAKGSSYCRPCATARQKEYRAGKRLKSVKAKPPTLTPAERAAEWRQRTGYKTPKRTRESSIPPFNVFEVAANPIYQRWTA